MISLFALTSLILGELSVASEILAPFALFPPFPPLPPFPPWDFAFLFGNMVLLKLLVVVQRQVLLVLLVIVRNVTR